MKRWLTISIACAAVAVAAAAASPPARADDGGGKRPMAAGFQLDLFPTVVSALDGNLGYAPQVWLGVGPARLRLVGAHLEPPDGLAFADEGFINPSTTVLAAIIDYTFGDHFDGWWVGAGFEQWQRTIEHRQVPGARATWHSTIATVGGGYIWRVAGNFYLDVWAALHATMNPETVTIGPHAWRPGALTPSGSLKVGYFFDL